MLFWSICILGILSVALEVSKQFSYCVFAKTCMLIFMLVSFAEVGMPKRIEISGFKRHVKLAFQFSVWKEFSSCVPVFH